MESIPKTNTAYFTREHYERTRKEKSQAHLKKLWERCQRRGEGWECVCGLNVNYTSRFAHRKSKVHAIRMGAN